MMKRIKLLLFLLIFSCSAQAQTPAWVTDWFDHINTTMINGPANGGTKLYVGGLFDTVIAKIWQQTKNKINTTDTAAMLAGYINWLTFLDSLRDHWSAIQNISLTPGPAGADGSPGSDGVNGADGATWITGTGSPVGFGVNSDLYLDVSNGDVYKKTSGSWGLLTNIMGPVGPTGSGHFFADSIKLAHDTLAAHNTRLKNIEQAGYITGYTEIDPVANAKTVTMGSGYGLTGGGAAQALSANPSRTLLLDSGTVYPAVVSTLGAGTGISVSGRTIINTSPDQTVSLTGGYGITPSGTYPAFTITEDTATTFAKVLSTLGSGYGITYTGRTIKADTATTFPAVIGTLAAGSGVTISGRTISATGTGGTVTSVSSGNLSPVFTSSVTTSTTTPAISYTLSNAGAYTVLCNTTNASAAPVYSKIDAANMLFGITPVANGGTGTTTTTSVNATAITYGANNTVPAAANTLTTTTLNPTVVTSSLTSIGNSPTMGTAGTASGSIVSIDGTQTLTNKTLTAAVLGSSTATTQSANDNSTKVATTAYVDGSYTPLSTYNYQTGTSYTLVAGDKGKVIVCNNASAITLTVPASLGSTFYCTVVQLGAGAVTPTASSTTLRIAHSYTKSNGQYTAFSIIFTNTTDTYLVQGDMQ